MHLTENDYPRQVHYGRHVQWMSPISTEAEQILTEVLWYSYGQQGKQQLHSFRRLFCCFLKSFVFWRWVSLCSPNWSGTHYVDQVSLKFAAVLRSLLLDCWDCITSYTFWFLFSPCVCVWTNVCCQVCVRLSVSMRRPEVDISVFIDPSSPYIMGQGSLVFRAHEFA